MRGFLKKLRDWTTPVSGMLRWDIWRGIWGMKVYNLAHCHWYTRNIWDQCPCSTFRPHINTTLFTEHDGRQKLNAEMDANRTHWRPPTYRYHKQTVWCLSWKYWRKLTLPYGVRIVMVIFFRCFSRVGMGASLCGHVCISKAPIYRYLNFVY